jgi:AcrR family transcriptional regulator
MKRSSKIEWCEQGLSLLRESGPQAITIERLCERLSKTKGSFYHHFKDLSAFQEAMLARWQEQYTEAPIAMSNKEGSAEKKARRLEAIVGELDHVLDTAIRAWARSDPRALAAVWAVDVKRMRFLGQLHKEAQRPRPEALGELEYAAFVGLQHLALSPKRKAVLARTLAQAFAGLSADQEQH